MSDVMEGQMSICPECANTGKNGKNRFCGCNHGMLRREQVLPLPDPPDFRSIDEQFNDFHATNPHVYALLCGLARQAKQAGHTKLGMGQLFEVLRWNQTVGTGRQVNEFKLNNNYRSRYARLIMSQEEDLHDIFTIRQLQR